MTEKEILELEKDNFTTIHLHLVGIFWRAYQRSALGFCKEIRPYKMNVRSNKRQRTVVSYLGFPDSALQEILAINGSVRLDDSHITLPMQYLSDEEVAETLPAYNDLPEKVRAVVTPSLSGQIMAFPLHSSTPLECMEFANFYLAPFDHYCKHTLGLRYYGRYVDDFFVVHSDPDCLKSLIPQFKEFLSSELKARLHPNKTRLTDYHKGISFIGVTVKGSTMLSGQRIKKNTRKALQGWNELAENRKLTDEEVERFTQMMNSYLGLMRHHNSYKLRVSLLASMSSGLRKYFCINTPDKVISWDRVRHKAWLSARRECYSRLWALRRKYPDKKFSFEELYNDICMERYLKRMGGI